MCVYMCVCVCVSIYICVCMYMIYLFVFGCAGYFGCCTQAFSGCAEQGLLPAAGRGLHMAPASAACGSQALGRRLSSRGAGTEAREIFLDQGSNPCPLHWQQDS